MNKTEIIVYRSKTEQALDAWMWENGLLFFGCIAFAVAFVTVLLLLTRKKGY